MKLPERAMLRREEMRARDEGSIVSRLFAACFRV